METIANALNKATMQSTPRQQRANISSEAIGRWLDAKGFKKSIAGDDFKIACDALKESMSRDCGMFLTGNCGSGKTHFMRMLYLFAPSRNQKYWIDCSDVDTVWMLNPKDNARYRELFNYNLFLDDLGTEVKIEYGRRTDFVAEFLRQFHAKGKGKLYITTNLNHEMLLKIYDERVVDRIFEMCVMAKFNGESKRAKVVVK